MKRILAAILALAMAGNGVVMLAAGRWWYGAVPGVTATGPFNPHFVADIGAAYLVVGAALGWLAVRASATARGATLAGAAFLALHALVHLADAATSRSGLADLARDVPGVFVPALVAGFLALPDATRPKESAHAQGPAAQADPQPVRAPVRL